MTGSAATAYNVINTLLTIVPLGIITYVLFLLWKRTFKKIPGSNIVLVICFAGLWVIVGWMLNRDFNTKSYEVSYSSYQGDPIMDEETNKQQTNEKGDLLFVHIPITKNTIIPQGKETYTETVTVGEQLDLLVGDQINILHKNNEKTEFSYLNEEALEKAIKNAEERGVSSEVIKAEVIRLKGNEVEITVSWFSILNSFFIIAFASLFSKWWESKYNPSAVGKYALGLIVMAVGFGLLAYGSYGIQEGVKVSMLWLILAYLFHTLGELCLSPVGLSYVSKLVPARMIAFMFGMWYLAIAIGNKLAAVVGGQIDAITEQYSLSVFFLIFTIVPLVAGLLILALGPLMKKLMHGVK
jgi:POT family proton-dependent oligopeptide transporter